MPGKHRKRPTEPALEPVPAEILDHFVGQGPLTPEGLEIKVRPFKKAVDRARPGRRADAPPRLLGWRRET